MKRLGMLLRPATLVVHVVLLALVLLPIAAQIVTSLGAEPPSRPQTPGEGLAGMVLIPLLLAYLAVASTTLPLLLVGLVLWLRDGKATSLVLADIAALIIAFLLWLMANELFSSHPVYAIMVLGLAVPAAIGLVLLLATDARAPNDHSPSAGERHGDHAV